MGRRSELSGDLRFDGLSRGARLYPVWDDALNRCQRRGRVQEGRMFQLLFKYPEAVFSKGRFVLLGAWPRWLLVLSMVLAASGLAWLLRSRLGDAVPELRNWRAWAIWGLQSAFVALVLLLLWQPAMVIAELSSGQNIIAVVVDDSRSMAIADSDGRTREAAAVGALEGGVLRGLEQRF